MNRVTSIPTAVEESIDEEIRSISKKSCNRCHRDIWYLHQDDGLFIKKVYSNGNTATTTFIGDIHSSTYKIDHHESNYVCGNCWRKIESCMETIYTTNSFGLTLHNWRQFEGYIKKELRISELTIMISIFNKAINNGIPEETSMCIIDTPAEAYSDVKNNTGNYPEYETTISEDYLLLHNDAIPAFVKKYGVIPPEDWAMPDTLISF